MGMYKHIREAWKTPKKTLGDTYKQYLMQFRREPVTLRILRPTRLDRARSLGYKAKQGIILVRQKVGKGGHMLHTFTGGRRPKANTRKKVVNKSYQSIAEERVAKHYPNCEVLNSYLVVEDGSNKWYEVILVDRTSPVILKDENLNWISLQKGRVFRGLTSAGKKSRGLRSKGLGAEKVRPSQKANKNRLH